jgi:hypothetical protein
MELKTTDLYLAAYLLNCKIQPIRIITKPRRNGFKPKIIFVFNSNDNVVKRMEAFHSGNATANVVRFRHDYETVRDWMYAKMREAEPCKSLTYH